MSNRPDLFDRTLLTQRRTRAARAPALFLHKAAVDEVSERLRDVNRTFTKPAVIGPWAKVWHDRLVAARVLAPGRCLPDAETLPLAPGTRDLIVHGLALHWINDPVGQLIQMRRALVPDGLMIAALFGGQSLIELRAALATAETEVLGGLSPRVAPMAEIRELGALLQRAGFALPVADSLTLTITYESLPALIRDLRAMAETNVLTQRHKAPMDRRVLALAEAIYRDRFPAQEPGRIVATVEIIFLTGWCPAENQQKPLRPGSALTRLADALGTDETHVRDRPTRDLSSD